MTKQQTIWGKAKDSFVNFAAKLGIGAQNLTSRGSYSFDFLTRDRITLEAAYRTSWVVRQAVDVVADDMVQGGIKINASLTPEQIEGLQAKGLRDTGSWQALNKALKWDRLFGGAIAVMIIDGQDTATPLNMDSIAPGSFKGLIVLDRWQLSPELNELITELGPDLGKPKYYEVISDGWALPSLRIHHSRVLRFDGEELPYFQRYSENGWGESVVEIIHDRLLAFDSTTSGAAQLVFKAHLRTMKIEGLRDLIAAGGQMLDALVQNVNLIRQFQSSEGLTLLDSKDELEYQSYTFAGLSDVLLMFGQQLSGALQIPLVRFFGQSPSGLNSSGESDLRTYYDGIRRRQEPKLRRPLTRLLDVICRSVCGVETPPDFTFEFSSLWQMTPEQRASVANQNTQTVTGAFEANLISEKTALKELKQQSHDTGVWTNITDEDINNASDEVELPGEEDLGLPGLGLGTDPGNGEPVLKAPEEGGKEDRGPDERLPPG